MKAKTNFFDFLKQFSAPLQEILEKGNFIEPTEEVSRDQRIWGEATQEQKALYTLIQLQRKKKEKKEKNTPQGIRSRENEKLDSEIGVLEILLRFSLLKRTQQWGNEISICKGWKIKIQIFIGED